MYVTWVDLNTALLHDIGFVTKVHVLSVRIANVHLRRFYLQVCKASCTCNLSITMSVVRSGLLLSMLEVLYSYVRCVLAGFMHTAGSEAAILASQPRL